MSKFIYYACSLKGKLLYSFDYTIQNDYNEEEEVKKEWNLNSFASLPLVSFILPSPHSTILG